MKKKQVITIILAQSPKKNIILCFLLFLAGIPVFFPMYTMIERRIIGYRMEKKLERENLQTITLDTASLIWLKENKEILINGEPFDIKKITWNGNKVTVSGLYDLWEKALHRLVAYNNSKHNTSLASRSVLLLMFTSYCQANATLNLAVPFFIYKKHDWQNCQDNICSLYQAIITPPPRFI